MRIEIKSWITGKVLFAHEQENNSLKITLEAGIKAKTDLSVADLRGSNLRGSNLRGSNLRWSNLIGADLSEANLSEADLRWSDLRGSNLRGSNLRWSDLSWSDLSKANLREADLSVAAPIVADLDAKMSAACAVEGALDMSDWHKCETTHCRAGWAITLAGEAGKDLESRVGSCAAGALIYHASTGRIPDFYASNEDAMADILECAKK